MKIALAIPHTPWVKARVDSLARLKTSLNDSQFCAYRQFEERAENSVWSVKLWRWLTEQDCEWCLQLQDDVMLAPCFGIAIHAMLEALPLNAEIVGLTSTHPMSIEWARRGHRWYRTDAMLVGWAYAIRRRTLAKFLEARDAIVERVGDGHEDVLLGQYASRSPGRVWHPCPTIVDHDTSLESSYQNDHHSHRRPQVTWRDYGEGSLTDPSWWKPSGMPQILPMPAQRVCWFCQEHEVIAESATNGVGICGVCIGRAAGMALHGGRR